MEIKIQQEEIFKTRGTSFGISKTANGYTLSYSFDKVNWSDWEEPVPAGEQLIVNNIVTGTWIKLKGNTEELTAII